MSFHQILPNLHLGRLYSLDYIVGGVLLYTLSTSLFMYYLPQSVCWLLDLVGLLFTFYGFKIRRKKFNIDRDLKFCAVFMFIWGGWILLISMLDNEFNIPHIVTQPSYVLPLLLPIFLFLNIRSNELRLVYNYIYVGCFCAFLHLIFHFQEFVLETSNTFANFHQFVDVGQNELGFYFYLASTTVATIFLIPMAIFYISGNIPNQTQKTVLVMAMALSIITTMSFGRRGSSIMILAIFILQFAIYIRWRSKHKILFILLGIVSLILILAYFYIFIDLFPVLSDRLQEDTRSRVEQDFWNSTTVESFIFGKGLHGTYKSDYMNRSLIETGYLYIILQKGILYLIPYVYLIIVSAFRGLFQGRSLFVKSLSLFLLYELCLLYPGGNPQWSLQHFVLFLSISICGCSSWRHENEIPNYIKN